MRARLEVLVMHRRTASRHESEWATMLGGHRVPLSGQGGQPDVVAPGIVAEIKAGSVTWPRIRQGLHQIERAAPNYPDCVPIVAVTLCHGRGQRRHCLVVVSLATWQALHGEVPPVGLGLVWANGRPRRAPSMERLLTALTAERVRCLNTLRQPAVRVSDEAVVMEYDAWEALHGPVRESAG